MESLVAYGHIGLFIASFLAATILPLSSEVVLSALLLNDFPAVPLVLVATLGNVLGSITNYALGYWASLGPVKKWFKLSEQEFVRAEKRFNRYGLISLCFAWVPIIGDPLTIVAGVLRIHLLWFIVLVTLGKMGRYIVVSYLSLQV